MNFQAGGKQLEEKQKQFGFDTDEYDLLDSDRIIIKRIRSGELCARNELIRKYEKTVKKIACKYFVAGGDENDLSQEGMFGLLNAIDGYDLSKDIPFSAFAITCIKRKIVTAIKNSTRQKHIPLNQSISLTQEAFGDQEDGRQVIDTIDAQSPDVADTVAAKESLAQIYSKMNSVLSPLEKDVFQYRLNGYSYEQMATKIGTTSKAIDNAVQRIKGKLIKYINGSDEIEI